MLCICMSLPLHWKSYNKHSGGALCMIDGDGVNIFHVDTVVTVDNLYVILIY